MKYIKPTSSWCYDETGITFPEKIPLCWEELLPGVPFYWEEQFGWSNQPKMIHFENRYEAAAKDAVRAIGEVIGREPCLRVADI